MTTHEEDYAKMARLAYRELTDQRPQWEQRSPAMVADFEQLNNFLAAFEEVASRTGGHAGQGEVDARDQAEHAAEVAAGRIVRGLRVLQLSVPNSAIAGAAGFTPSSLNPLHGEELLNALNTIAGAAASVAPLLANEGVTADHLQALDDAIALYTPLASLNNSNAKQGGAISGTVRQVVKGLRGVLHRLDARIDNLRDEIPGLAQRYDAARRSDSTYVAQSSGPGPLEGGDGSDGGIGRAAAGDAFGPEPGPEQQAPGQPGRQPS
jgi:hypothetical protein